VQKDGLMSDLEERSLQMEDDLVRAFNGLEIYQLETTLKRFLD